MGGNPLSAIIDFICSGLSAQAETQRTVGPFRRYSHCFQHRRNFLLAACAGASGGNIDSVAFQCKQHRLASYRGQSDIQDVWCRLRRIRIRSVDSCGRNPSAYFRPQSVFKVSNLLDIIRMPGGNSRSHADDSVSIFCTRSDSVLLPTAELQGPYCVIAVVYQSTGPFQRMKFMT